MHRYAEDLNKWFSLETLGTSFRSLEQNKEIPSYHPKVSEEYRRCYLSQFAYAWNWIGLVCDPMM